VKLGERTLKMEDLDAVIAGRKEWQRQLAARLSRLPGRRPLAA
jgi:hypothetical protein